MVTSFVKTGALVEKKFREFFIPTVLASMAGQLGSITNGIIVGNFIGANAMAAVSACLPLNQIVSALGILISTGSTGLIAIAAGERDNKKADYIFSTVLTLGIIFAIILAVILVPQTKSLTNILSSVEELQPLIFAYLSLLVFRVPIMLVALTWEMMLRVDGQAKIISRGIAAGQVINVLLTFLFVGVLEKGIAGAGVALICSDIISGGYMIFRYLNSPERSRKFFNVFTEGLGKFFTQSIDVMKSGVPAACSIGLVSFKVWAIYQILGETGGADGVTLFAVCMACLSVVSMCISGCNGAMMPVVGMIYGERDFAGVRNLVKYVLKFALTLAGIFVAFAMIFPQIILSLYNIPENLFAEGAMALRLFSISLLGVTITFLVMYYYSTIQRRTIANILSITEGALVVVPAAWILSKSFGLNGVWIAFILAELAGFFVVWICANSICKNSGGKLNDIFLIEQNDSELIMDVSLIANTENAAKISRDAKKILEKKNFDKTVALKVGVALEEMTLNIEKLNGGKEINADVRIKTEGEKIIVSLRDNGKSFNPLEYSVDEEENLHTDGIMLLKNLAKEIKYNRVLSLNQTFIEI